MRCPNCNKFVALDMQDPEVESIDIEGDTVQARVRIVRACSECGTELKEATLELEYELPDGVNEHVNIDGHELEVVEDGVDPTEEGGSRYQKSYFGATIDFTVKCSCGKYEFSDQMSDKIAASQMDELA